MAKNTKIFARKVRAPHRGEIRIKRSPDILSEGMPGNQNHAKQSWSQQEEKGWGKCNRGRVGCTYPYRIRLEKK